MADDPALLARLRFALTGSNEAGRYPDTVVNRLDVALDAAFELAEARGVLGQVKVVAGSEAGPWRTPTSVLDDVRQQATSRFRFDDASKWRNLAEKAQQLANILAVLPEQPSSSTPAPSTPTPRLPEGTEQGKLLHAVDLTRGSVVSAGYLDTPWNRQADGGEIGKGGPSWPPRIVDAGGRRALAFTLGASDTRIEVEPDHQRFDGKAPFWFGYQFLLPDGFPLGADDWRVIWQLHGNDTVSPRFVHQVRGGQLRVGDSKALTTLRTGRWCQAVVCADFPNGVMSTWLDGQALGAVKVGKSAAPYYLKAGLYQAAGLPGATIYQRAHRMGTGYGAVVSPD